MDTKLTVRVPEHLLANAKRYAKAHQTTLTESYFSLSYSKSQRF